MGSATYEWILGHSSDMAVETGSAWPYSQPVWVFSSRVLPIVEGADIVFVKGEVGAVHEQMAAVAGAKNIWIAGGGDLAGQFYDAGLLDEMIIQLGSVTLGKGKQLFPRRLVEPPLHLSSARQMGGGMIELRYEVRYA